MTQVWAQYARYNRLANRTLYEACGGLSDAAVFATIWPRLAAAGMLVANAVTLEGEARLVALQKQHGGDLVRIDIAHLELLGQWRSLRPTMPVLQWRVCKPW